MKINFDGLRANIAQRYNSLATNLNSIVNEGNDTFSAEDIQRDMDELRDGLAWLMSCEQPGEFGSLPVDLVEYNPEGKSGY